MRKKVLVCQRFEYVCKYILLRCDKCLETVHYILKKKQVNKNILEKLVAYRLKDNGGVKSTET